MTHSCPARRPSDRYRGDQVGLEKARPQGGTEGRADLADIVGMPIVEHILEAESTGHRQIPALGKSLHFEAALRSPAASAHQHQWAPGDLDRKSTRLNSSH